MGVYEALKSHFQDGDIPSGQDFSDLIDLLHDITYRGPWGSGLICAEKDLVKYGRFLWFSLQSSVGLEPGALGSEEYWSKFAVVDELAENVSYTFGPLNFTNVKQALDYLLNPYVNTDISASNSIGNIVEIGLSAENFTVDWVVNPVGRVLTSQTLNGVSKPVGDRSALIAGPITTNTTWTVAGTDGISSDSAATGLDFRYRRFWGASALTTLTDAEIKGLNSDLGPQSKIQARSIVCSGQYMYFAWPKIWGGNILTDFRVNNFISTSWTLERTDNFVNAQGLTYEINLYRSNNVLNGTFNVEVS
jgi:hypothetical protein